MIATFNFQANIDCFIGGHFILIKDDLYVNQDIQGMYWLYSPDYDEPLAHLNKDDVIKLAGCDIFALRELIQS